MEAFFGDRNKTQHEHETKKATEFLNLIGGSKDNIKSKVFFYSAPLTELKL